MRIYEAIKPSTWGQRHPTSLPHLEIIYDWDIDRHHNGIMSGDDWGRFRDRILGLPHGTNVCLDIEFWPSTWTERVSYAFLSHICHYGVMYRPDCSFGVYDRAIGDHAFPVCYVSDETDSEIRRVLEWGTSPLFIPAGPRGPAIRTGLFSPHLVGRNPNSIMTKAFWLELLEAVRDETGLDAAIWANGWGWWVPAYLEIAEEVAE